MTGLIAWIIGFVSFWPMAVLWVLLPFNMTPDAKRDRPMLLPIIVLLPGSFFMPKGRTIRAWIVSFAILFSGTVIVGITMAKALQQMPSAS
jgi:hypothetical protein